MAGGKGTRIASVRSDIPKPMIPVLGKPILEWQIECLKKNGITDILIGIGHLGNFIRDYFGDGKKFGVDISYYEEKEPLGTAGFLFKAQGLDKDFLLLCGDTIFDIDFNRFINFHQEKKALASLMTHPNNHPYDSSLIVTEIEYPQEGSGGMPADTHKVAAWLAKEDERLWYKNRVNAGIQIISPELLNLTRSRVFAEGENSKAAQSGRLDLDRDVLKPAVKTGRIYAYDTTEYIKDMGTPDRLEQVEADLKSGLVQDKNLSQKQRAIFLDRDGTLNKEVNFLTNIDDLELLPGAAEAVKKINQAGYLAIVITNQPVIARGEITLQQLNEIHAKLETLLGREGAYIDGLYFCPHHPDKGFEGERPEYKRDCECRKPKAGMVLQAARDFNIDLSASYMIGDRDKDVECGQAAGLKQSVLCERNGNLLEALNKISL
jgi:D,D-heptose 1,7-bisphosphate phosphatase